MNFIGEYAPVISVIIAAIGFGWMGYIVKKQEKKSHKPAH